LGKNKGRRRRGRIRKKYKKVADVEKIKEDTGSHHISLIACPMCLEEANLLVIINFGDDNYTEWGQNALFAKCPICQYERPRNDNHGEEWWIPYHLPAIQARTANIVERREAQLDDHIYLVRKNYG